MAADSQPLSPRPPGRPADLREYAWVAVAIGLLTVLGILIPERYSVSVGLLYLLAILFLSLRVGRWPMLLAAALSAISWDFFFIEPRFQLRIGRLQDLLILVVYFALALVVGQLVNRVREQARRERIGQERERLLRTLLDSVSHELRTPLAVITGSLENFAAAPAPVQANLLAEMQTAARRLNRLVRNLLDQTRLESGHLQARLDWCDPRDLVNAVADGVGDELSGRPFTVRVAEDMPPVRMDFTLMEHALSNLLLNVARHTPPGTPALLTVALDPARGAAVFTVEDRGPGLLPAVRERGFAKPAIEPGSGPHGFGMSIVRGFVAAQGGELDYADNPGGGAVFTICLPYAAPQSGGAS